MLNALERYWTIKLESCKKALEANGFESFVVQNRDDARGIVIDEILPRTEAKILSWGDSLTLKSTGIFQVLEEMPEIEIIHTFEKDVPREEILQRRRRALLCDLFMTGSNAVTEDGKLINLDMVGNRVTGITFGPKHVIILAGRNKIVPDIETGMEHIKQWTAPLNAIRHEMETPCVRTATCHDCKSPDRICNVWTITEKSYPARRIKVILINEDLGI